MKQMVSASLNTALKLLSTASTEPLQITRELIVAFATVTAWTQHWPSQATPEAWSELARFAWIRDQELDRYLKQRRIALARLARELSTSELKAQ